MTNKQQVKLLNLGSYITRAGTGKKPFSPAKALTMLQNLGVKR